jgi:hypothetical protein
LKLVEFRRGEKRQANWCVSSKGVLIQWKREKWILFYFIINKACESLYVLLTWSCKFSIYINK